MERLQKLIAQAGLCSRRKAEEFIVQGKVRVNGVVVKELGSKASPNDNITVDGKKMKRDKKVYLVMNKPTGCVTTLSDPEGRKIITDLIDIPERVFPVGRLDYNTSGVLILTNDGDLANKLAHPSFKVPKTYYVKLKQVITRDVVEQLEKGIMMDGKPTMPCKIKLLSKENDHSKLEMTIFEGRNRQVRRMFEHFNLSLMKLSRIKYGVLDAKNIRPGEWVRVDKAVLENINGIKKK